MYTNSRFTFRNYSPELNRPSPSNKLSYTLGTPMDSRVVYNSLSPTQQTATPKLPALRRTLEVGRWPEVNRIGRKLESHGVRASDYGIRVPDMIKDNLFYVYSHGQPGPIALGLLVAECVLLTSASAIPNPISANSCYAKSMSAQYACQCIPQRLFYLNSELNLTAVYIYSADRLGKVLLDYDADIVLEEGEKVYYVTGDIYQSTVYSIDTHSFIVHTPNPVLNGTACFNTKWEFKGLCTGSSKTHKFSTFCHVRTLAKLVESLNKNLEGVKWCKFQETPQYAEPGKNLTWIQWKGRYVESYDTQEDKWVCHKVKELEVEWNFYYESRTIEVSDGSILIIGGEDDGIGVKNVYRYKLGPNTVTELSPMLMQRSATALAQYEGYIYAISGKHCSSYCEVYNIASNSWQSIPNCYFPRSNHSAIAVNSRVYVVGGQHKAGARIECYWINEREWEVLFVKLSHPVLRPPVCSVTNHGFVIFCGSAILYLDGEDELTEVGKLSQPIQTVYPTWYVRSQQRFLILDCSEGFKRPMLHKIHEGYIDWRLIK